jgi:hypothetical protein
MWLEAMPAFYPTPSQQALQKDGLTIQQHLWLELDWRVDSEVNQAEWVDTLR